MTPDSVSHYFFVLRGVWRSSMETVTVTLPDELARWVEVRAAENNRGMPEWIVRQLETMRLREDDYDVAMNRFLARVPESRKLEWVGGRKPTREELHDRAALRRHPVEEDAGDG